MTEVILCFVALAFLGWVLVLKVELAELKRAHKKLQAMLALGVRKMTQDVEVLKDEKSWGKKKE